MAIVDLVMPKLGESIMEATILKWLKKPGDSIEEDEAVLEIATDKVDSEVPSTTAGTLREVLFSENDVVPIGTVIARIDNGKSASAQPDATAGQSDSAQPAQSAPPAAKQKAEEEEAVPFVPNSPQANAPKAESAASVRFYSPLVLRIAQEEGIPMAELETIPGTGMDGRVSKKDILGYLENRGAKQQQPNQPSPQQTPQPVQPEAAARESGQQEMVRFDPVIAGNVEVIEMDRMRKMIAKHMVHSKHTSAHVTSFTEADVTNLVLWREKIKKEFENREGVKITFTPLFIEAVVKCLKKYPLLNSSVDGDRILIRKDINLGMATALPSGNLIVPVIKNADQFNLVGLTKQVNGLAESARTGKLRPDDTSGGTFTLTNVGTFGSLMGTPIINQPQVAVLAVGTIKKRPVVIESEQGDSIAIRSMMYLSMSYDHRIIDGALGATFLTAVARELENYDINRSI